jgi:calcineurin-like phosphoesterase family protein
MIWFTSDMHYGHTNIIKYANRPFKHVDEMDQTMEDSWRACVRPADTVYVLGDCAFYKDQTKTIRLFSRLPGTKYLVWGNHDKHIRKNAEFRKLFVKTEDLLDIKVPDQTADGGERRIVLCHYAMRVWNKSHFGSYQLYGHSHGSLPDDPHSLSLDVGVDCWGFQPVTFEQVRERMARKTFKPIDHHDRDRYGKQ